MEKHWTTSSHLNQLTHSPLFWEQFVQPRRIYSLSLSFSLCNTFQFFLVQKKNSTHTSQAHQTRTLTESTLKLIWKACKQLLLRNDFSGFVAYKDFQNPKAFLTSFYYYFWLLVLSRILTSAWWGYENHLKSFQKRKSFKVN